jgi:hypothetical protein
LNFENLIGTLLKDVREISHRTFDLLFVVISTPHVSKEDIFGDEPRAAEVIFDGDLVSVNFTHVKVRNAREEVIHFELLVIPERLTGFGSFSFGGCAWRLFTSHSGAEDVRSAVNEHLCHFSGGFGL